MHSLRQWWTWWFGNKTRQECARCCTRIPGRGCRQGHSRDSERAQLAPVVHLVCVRTQLPPAHLCALIPASRYDSRGVVHALPSPSLGTPQSATVTNMTQTRESDGADVPSSPEDGGNFKRGLQIDMKGLVGDAVGNVSRLMRRRENAPRSDRSVDEHKPRKQRRRPCCVRRVES